jgi:hypothetical protein
LCKLERLTYTGEDAAIGISGQSTNYFNQDAYPCLMLSQPYDAYASKNKDTTIAFNVGSLKLPFYLVSYERYLIEQYK